ncbi:putative amino acid permease YhdG [Planctomycetes bacterium Poly30]|uniref:Putative amino acid permease YhdG n=1 Tax=Saltatorellus ferox TaxID=2528018 RepID=A0A518EMI7_9BACT|nr:putative amino acid permease YhdG [Planctomycetes bacterium Poly30]
MAQAQSGAALSKELRLLDVYALATGATLSAGLFLLPGIAAAQAGVAIPLCYLIAAIPLVPAVMCKVELATAMPKAGGTYYFLDRSLGPLAGTVGGLGTWLALILKTAFALVGLGAYVSLYLEPSPILTKSIAIGFALAFGTLNILGAKKTAVFQKLLVGGLLIILTVFSVLGVPEIDFGAFKNFFAAGSDSLIATAGTVYISYVGVTKVISVAEEIKNPEKTLPRAVLLSMITAVVVYLLTTTIMVGVVPMAELAGNETPMAAAASKIAGSFGKAVISVAAVLAFFSVANAGILSASRYPMAMATDRLVPGGLAKLSGRGTPARSIVLSVSIIIVIVAFLDPLKIAKLASAFQLLIFALQCLAVMVMRESGLKSYDPSFRAPFYPWLPLFGLLAPFFLIAAMGTLPVLFSLGLIAGGVGWYWTYGRERVDRRGAVFHVFARLGEQRHEGLDTELRGILKTKGLRDEDPFDQVVFSSTVIDVQASVPFDTLIDRAASALHARTGRDASLFVQGFTEGTKTGATPVAKGVALPHMRIEDFGDPCLVLVRAHETIEIKGGDVFGNQTTPEQVHAIFFLVSDASDPGQHLRMLAKLASRIDEEDFLDGWLGARNEVQLREVFLRNERYLSIKLEDGSPAASLVGKSIEQLELPEDSLIAAIRRDGATIMPRASSVLQPGDRLIVIGESRAITQLREQFGRKDAPAA